MSVRPSASVFVVVFLALSTPAARAQDASCVAQVNQYQSDWKALGDEAARQGLDMVVGDGVDAALSGVSTMMRTAAVDIRRLSATQFAQFHARIDAARDALQPFNQALRELIECGTARLAGTAASGVNCVTEFENKLRNDRAGRDMAQQWLQGLDNTGTLGAMDRARSFSTALDKVGAVPAARLATSTAAAGVNCLNQLQQRLQATPQAVDPRQPPSSNTPATTPKASGGSWWPVTTLLGGAVAAGLYGATLIEEPVVDSGGSSTPSQNTGSNNTGGTTSSPFNVSIGQPSSFTCALNSSGVVFTCSGQIVVRNNSAALVNQNFILSAGSFTGRGTFPVVGNSVVVMFPNQAGGIVSNGCPRPFTEVLFLRADNSQVVFGSVTASQAITVSCQ